MPNCLATRTWLASARATPDEASKAAVATATISGRSIAFLPPVSTFRRDPTRIFFIRRYITALGTAIASRHYPAQTGGRMTPQVSMAATKAPLLAVENVTLQYKTEQHL